MDYTVIHESPHPKAYNELRLEAGMSGKSLEAAEIGLRNSLYAVTLYDDEVLIGMGRIIGDGGAFFQIVDIAVKPTYQGNGLGRVIMEHLTNYLDQNTLPGSYVSLIADGEAEHLYKKFAFKHTAPRSQGMYRSY
ncbi:GNAT family N-acetyltransferase [Shouchella miscanthi]|uniref:GNAT family N-acetyltransferase n=1 Tax=Shouchella miscanthi TaxID=2598861 RepID=UPI001FE339A2|nr:GNAT family N-acetyltransferase [Shouchella miscanthi]